MLYNCVIIALSLVIPISAYLAFRTGYAAGRAVEQKADLAPLVCGPSKKEKLGQEPLTPEQERMNSILANIEHYDGTAEGQVRL